MRAVDQPEPDPLWPEKMLELCSELRSAVTIQQRNQILSRLWVFAHAAVSRYVRYHAHAGTVDPDDLKDIASEKALSFLQHVDDPAWTDGTTHPGQVCSYFSTLAHNGLMDHFRARRRWVEPSAVDLMRESASPQTTQPEIHLARRQFSEALHDCTSALSSKARLAWFLRVMLNMSTRDIARHPKIQMNGTAVDMMLSRSRKVVRECMQTKGFGPQDIPPGTLTILWQSVREELEEGERSE